MVEQEASFQSKGDGLEKNENDKAEGRVRVRREDGDGGRTVVLGAAISRRLFERKGGNRDVKRGRRRQTRCPVEKEGSLNGSLGKSGD